MPGTIRKYNQAAVLVISAFILTFFAYLTPPGNLADPPFVSNIFTSLQGDLAEYIQRFFLSFTLFGLVPLISLYLLFGKGGAMMPGRINTDFLRNKYYLMLIALCLVVGISSSRDPQLASYYPYSKTLTQMARTDSPLYFLIHALSYIFLYYVPWEIFFRGFLILPFLSTDGSDESNLSPRNLMVASFQVIPSAIIHFGHPISETLGAVPFGFLCGWLTVRYRSIIPGLILHIITGVTMDFFITFF